MNWKDANRLIAILFIFFSVSCTYFNKKTIITAQWNISSITRNNKASVRTQYTDFLKLNKDSTFQFNIEFVNFNGTGTWMLSADSLILNFTNTGKKETYAINFLSTQKLIITDSRQLVYTFTRD